SGAVRGVLRFEAGTFEFCAGRVLSMLAGWLFRGDRQRTRDRVASCRLDEPPAVLGTAVERKPTRSLHAVSNALVAATRSSPRSLHVGLGTARGGWACQRQDARRGCHDVGSERRHALDRAPRQW